MMKTIASAAALVLVVACSSTSSSSMKSSSTPERGLSGFAARLNDAPDYILLSAPSQVRTYDYSNTIAVKGLHIRGTMTSRGFLPAGDVQGNGKMCTDGKDWLSLADLTVHKASDGSPAAPYLLGCATSSGFQPASRQIVTN